MPSPGRKLLMAGRSGLNLTHAEDWDRFVGRYGLAADRLRPALQRFPPDALRAWAEDLGQETFVGSSGRVFPKSWKASPLLRAWLRRLDDLGVEFKLRHSWTGFGPSGELRFETPEGERLWRGNAVVLALGGGSWGRLGSDGSWVPIFARAGIRTQPLRPANCGLRIAWSQRFSERFEGAPLKRIALLHEGRRISGEAVVTAAGLEGGAVYTMSAQLRDAVEQSGVGLLEIDLRPDLSEAALRAALSRPRGKLSTSSFLRKSAGLAPVAIGLLREGRGGPALPQAPRELARLIKQVPVQVVGTDQLDRAISTAGGIALDEIDETFMLKKLPGIFAAGEMLDWEAPTGGYLLQACFATGVAAAQGAIAWASGRLKAAGPPGQRARDRSHYRLV